MLYYVSADEDNNSKMICVSADNNDELLEKLNRLSKKNYNVTYVTKLDKNILNPELKGIVNQYEVQPNSGWDTLIINANSASEALKIYFDLSQFTDFNSIGIYNEKIEII